MFGFISEFWVRIRRGLNSFIFVSALPQMWDGREDNKGEKKKKKGSGKRG